MNNAGYALFGAAEELSDDQVEAIIATNLTAPIHLTRAVLPHITGAGWLDPLAGFIIAAFAIQGGREAGIANLSMTIECCP